jgi:formate/nitrite transporter FocA (FNT family)
MKRLVFTRKAQFIFKSVLAGVLIALAGSIYLSCTKLISNQDIAKVVGSFLFSIGLIAVLVLDTNLFTGKVGYVDSWHKFGLACACLVYNVLVAFFIGLLYQNLTGSVAPGPMALGSDRLAKSWYKMLADGCCCGALIYLAVELYRRTKNLIPVIICVMAFILSGTEHSIADAFYFGASTLSWKGLGYLGLAIIGNSLGAVALHWLQVGMEKLNEIPENLHR